MTAQQYQFGATPTPAQIRSSLQADRSPRNVRGCLPSEDHAAFDAAYQEALGRISSGHRTYSGRVYRYRCARQSCAGISQDHV